MAQSGDSGNLVDRWKGRSMFARIAERRPQLTLIIDHILNSSNRTNNVTDVPAAIDQTVALARNPTSASSCRGRSAIRFEPYRFRDTKTYVQRVFDTYGPSVAVGLLT
jgi:hypothetical protein